MSKNKRPAYYLGWEYTCKDCKYSHYEGDYGLICSHPRKRIEGNICVNSDDSCAFLERKDESNE